MIMAKKEETESSPGIIVLENRQGNGGINNLNNALLRKIS